MKKPRTETHTHGHPPCVSHSQTHGLESRIVKGISGYRPRAQSNHPRLVDSYAVLATPLGKRRYSPEQSLTAYRDSKHPDALFSQHRRFQWKRAGPLILCHGLRGRKSAHLHIRLVKRENARWLPQPPSQIPDQKIPVPGHNIGHRNADNRLAGPLQFEDGLVQIGRWLGPQPEIDKQTVCP